jgi:hypothetical protein
MKNPISKTTPVTRFLLGALSAMILASCTSPTTPFVDETVRDPRCKNVETWREDLKVKATYTDSGEISLHLDVGGDPAEISGDTTIEGAYASVVYYDVDSLWYLLVPDDGAFEITICGVLECAPEEQPYTVTLILSPDSDEIEYQIEFEETGDAGVGADAGK